MTEIVATIRLYLCAKRSTKSIRELRLIRNAQANSDCSIDARNFRAIKYNVNPLDAIERGSTSYDIRVT